VQRDLPAQGEYNVTAQAVDTAGQWATFGTTTTGTWRYLIYPGDLDPTITAALNQPMSPASAAALNGISVSGRAEDDPNTGGMTAVRITIRQGAGNYFSTTTNTFSSASAANINAFLTSPGSPGSNFSYATPLAANSAFTAGTYTITETPVDEWGQVGAPYVLTLTLT